MTSRATKSSTKSKKYEGQKAIEASGTLSSEIAKLRKEIRAARFASIKEKLIRNAETVGTSTFQLCGLSESKKDLRPVDQNESEDMLSFRMKNPLIELHGGEKDTISWQEVTSSTVELRDNTEKIPPYTTWIFLDKNQRMSEDQSVVGRRQIYYDQCGEALISSDSEEEIAEPEEGKHEFSEGEDQLLWKALQKYGLTEEVLNILSQFIEVTPSEIRDRYNILMEQDRERHADTVEGSAEKLSERNIFSDKSLDAALDSFDNLFCRRCLVFDCRLHGCSQSVIAPREKQPYVFELEEDREPCSDHCYLRARSATEVCTRSEGINNDELPSHENLEKRKSAFGSYDFQGSSSKKQKKTSSPDVVSAEGASNSCDWKPIEKELYLKGIEIFGNNSCLIARNLLSGFKTCIEISEYMVKAQNAMASAVLPNSCMEDNGEAEPDYKEQEMSSRSRFLRRRGRAKKLKYSWKSSAHPSTRKRISGGKNKFLKHYTPCECQSMCGKDCPCFINETCCEKYCGCSKSCKYRFRGCHCAKSKCRSRQCPCFAANRECDPDVCRNCWVSCGGGSLGEPPARGEDHQCGNMTLLLKQQQRILLSKSDVAGWGAFLRNPVNKNDYLGEYTGELISHKEADKRGKIYDRENSSYLFDLDDQYVLDAYRKGNKLKFANHSAKPNCFAKMMMVAGDYRVGIYASENIKPGEELFYDYCYSPDTKFVWAQKAERSKTNYASAATGRARKHQSC